jgi:WD40 repeat protein
MKRPLTPTICLKRILTLTICLLVILFAPGLSTGQKPELVVQSGHSEKLTSLAFSPDGKTLASSSDDKTIKFWNFATGEQLRTIEGAEGRLAFGPDGKIIVSGGVGGVAVWDVSIGTKLRELSPNGADVVLSPNGRIIASGKRLWDTSTGAERILETKGSVDAVAFSPDGKLLASGSSSEGTVKLLDVSTGAEVRGMDAGIGIARSLAFSPNGKLLAGAGSTGYGGGAKGMIKIWDVSTGAELRRIDTGIHSVNTVAFSPDGKLLVSAGRQNSVKLWVVSTGAALAALDGYFSPVAFSSDGSILAAGNGDSTIKLWDLTTRSDVGALKGHSDFVSSAAFSLDGKTLAAGSRDGTVRLWDVSTGGLRTLKGHSGTARSVAFSPDGKVLASGGVDGTVKLWEVSTVRELRSLKQGHDRPDSVAEVVFSPDGKILASGGSYSSTIKLWDVEKGAELQTITGFGSYIAFSTDSKTLAFGEGGTVRLWNISTDADLPPLKIHPEGGLIESLAFSPDGKTLASASSGRGDSERIVKLWDFSSGRELHTLKGLHAHSIAFSSDGRMLAGGRWNGNLAIWDVQSGTELRTLTGGYAYINSIAFSPNNKYLVVGTSDSTLKIWDVMSGNQLATVIPLDQSDSLVVTPDGLFDGPPAAWNRILWRFNNNSFDHAPMEAFFNDFYYPGLLTDIFGGKGPKAPAEIAQKDRRQPRLRLGVAGSRANTSSTLRSVPVLIDVVEARAGAQDVRLFRNGSLVKVWRGDVLKGQSSVTLEGTVPIVAGENHLTAYAFNHDNIKSGDATLTITGADSLKRPGTAYILAVGVNRYSNPQYNLKYAVADAREFSAEVKRQQELLKRYARVEVISLSDAQATKANITQRLTELSTRVQPEDAVIIYFAGHGTAHGKQFYLIPHDLGYRGQRDKLSEASLQTILAHSISDRELEKLFEGMDAGQLLLVIDACNSGQALEAEEKRRGPMNSKGLAQLAYEKGMYVLTAAQSYQAAQEAAKLGHGFLTYALVEDGLKQGKADREQKDGTINLREWLNYATEQVPRMQEENMLEALRGRSRFIDFIGDGSESNNPGKSNVQRPRIFYRRELDSNPLVVAIIKAPAPQ